MASAALSQGDTRSSVGGIARRRGAGAARRTQRAHAFTRSSDATQQTHYDVLGVGRNASQKDIKKAYRKLARKWHPDVNSDTDTTETFKAIKLAAEILSDHQARASYDRDLAAREAAVSPSASTAGSAESSASQAPPDAAGATTYHYQRRKRRRAGFKEKPRRGPFDDFVVDEAERQAEMERERQRRRRGERTARSDTSKRDEATQTSTDEQPGRQARRRRVDVHAPWRDSETASKRANRLAEEQRELERRRFRAAAEAREGRSSSSKQRRRTTQQAAAVNGQGSGGGKERASSEEGRGSSQREGERVLKSLFDALFNSK